MGGDAKGLSVEAIGQDGSFLCSLPNLPGTNRYLGHTQTGLEICGGYDHNQQSCLSLTSAGVWETTRNLSQPRGHHSSWMSPSGLILLGGYDSESRGTAELVTDQGSSNLFQMKYQTRYDYIALNKPFMEVDGIGQLSRFHCIITYGTQIVSLKKSQSAANIWNFP